MGPVDAEDLTRSFSRQTVDSRRQVAVPVSSGLEQSSGLQRWPGGPSVLLSTGCRELHSGEHESWHVLETISSPRDLPHPEQRVPHPDREHPDKHLARGIRRRAQHRSLAE
jgi:hypothetical protein